MSESVWVVVSVNCGDYDIEGVFSTEARAEAYAAEVGKLPYRHDAHVRKWKLDDGYGLVARPCWKSYVNNKTGELYQRHADVELADPGLTNSLELARAYGNTVATSFVSQEHADELAIEGRRQWLKLKG